MIQKAKYEEIKKQYGKHSSWAIWVDEGDTPKSNIEKLELFDDEKILEKLNPNFVIVGLNPSGQDTNKKNDWCNFHSSDKKRQNDYKLRYALKDTMLWGAYMTDLSGIIKTDSNKVSVSEDDVKKFQEEISLLGTKPVLVALGDKVYKALKKYLSEEYSIIKIKHYACYINKEKYRDEVLEVLERFNKETSLE